MCMSPRLHFGSSPISFCFAPSWTLSVFIVLLYLIATCSHSHTGPCVEPAICQADVQRIYPVAWVPLYCELGASAKPRNACQCSAAKARAPPCTASRVATCRLFPIASHFLHLPKSIWPTLCWRWIVSGWHHIYRTLYIRLHLPFLLDKGTLAKFAIIRSMMTMSLGVQA